eukprot:scaffold4362_cov106-Isochrysis_galbana.AAC.4
MARCDGRVPRIVTSEERRDPGMPTGRIGVVQQAAEIDAPDRHPCHALRGRAREGNPRGAVPRHPRAGTGIDRAGTGMDRISPRQIACSHRAGAVVAGWAAVGRQRRRDAPLHGERFHVDEPAEGHILGCAGRSRGRTPVSGCSLGGILALSPGGVDPMLSLGGGAPHHERGWWQTHLRVQSFSQGVGSRQGKPLRRRRRSLGRAVRQHPTYHRRWGTAVARRSELGGLRRGQQQPLRLGAEQLALGCLKAGEVHNRLFLPDGHSEEHRSIFGSPPEEQPPRQSAGARLSRWPRRGGDGRLQDVVQPRL